MSAPVAGEARAPLFEVLSDDTYRLGSIDWQDSHYPYRVLDIGAHVGSFTCALAHYLPSAVFNCVEPSEDTASWLIDNLSRNGLSQRATVIRAAVGSHDGEGVLWETGYCSCTSSTRAQSGTPAQVRTRTLESLTREMGDPAHILKIDCEGAEYDLILGSPASCWLNAHHVFLEYHPVEGHGFIELEKRLEQNGLALMWHAPGRKEDLGLAYFGRASP